jgi:hypothetical protein
MGTAGRAGGLEIEAMLRQKLAYIHDKPVSRGYVDDPVHWRYSSARNYAKFEPVASHIETTAPPLTRPGPMRGRQPTC